MRLSIPRFYQVTGGFDGMTRRMQHFDGAVAQLEHFAILCEMYGELSLRTGPIYDGSAGGLGQIQVPAYKISMEMGFKYVLDRRISLFCQLEICIDIPQ